MYGPKKRLALPQYAVSEARTRRGMSLGGMSIVDGPALDGHVAWREETARSSRPALDGPLLTARS